MPRSAATGRGAGAGWEPALAADVITMADERAATAISAVKSLDFGVTPGNLGTPLETLYFQTGHIVYGRKTPDLGQSS
ncbi:hypothetical protein Cco03nite_16030 [Catellatospora coxensis]|uniref:Uncharacterized protein n=1 Tax=Catellatospora coxensis TaxID=310354 RepID=A0A8J3KRI2_9ACTN|nr:hypothetical protein Cco03nite_16030 [Catellatospora coxensis]